MIFSENRNPLFGIMPSRTAALAWKRCLLPALSDESVRMSKRLGVRTYISEKRTEAHRQIGPARPVAAMYSVARALPSPFAKALRPFFGAIPGAEPQVPPALLTSEAGSIFTPGPMVEEMAIRLMKCPFAPGGFAF